MSSSAPSVTGQWRLSGSARKWLLLTHLLSVALWFGVDIALGISVVTAFVTDDPVTAGTALQAVEIFAIWPMFAASLISLTSGVLLAVGSRYGLLRYWWVAIKLAINVLMSTLVLFALRPAVADGAEVGRRLVAGEDAQISGQLLFPVVVAPTLLLTAFVLGVWKPRARLRRRSSVARNPETRSSLAPRGAHAADSS